MSATVTVIQNRAAKGVGEIIRLSAGLSPGDVASLTYRFRAEVARVREIAEQRVAAGERLHGSFRITFSCAKLVDFRHETWDRLMHGTFEEHAANEARYLVECREMLGIEPGPVAVVRPAIQAPAEYVSLPIEAGPTSSDFPPVEVRPTTSHERHCGSFA
jgi:hypothetical protein